MPKLTRTKMRVSLLALSINLIAAASASARRPQDAKFSQIRIRNFGQMDERFFRGAQPKEEDFKSLAELGIKTIIDLRDDPKKYEKRAAEAAGMRYVNIPMSASSRPRDEQIQQFLKLVNDPNTGRFFVHCAGGRHRTGVVGAVYRLNHNGWDFEQAYREMKQFDFYTRWGHGSLKDYVRDYHKRLRTDSIVVSSGDGASIKR